MIEKGSIIISVQSKPNDPTDNEEVINAFMKSAIKGGAKGLRLASKRDIENAKKMFPKIPIIGLTKPEEIPKNFKELVYITPTVEDALNLISWGANIVAFDGTKRHDYSKIVKVIKEKNKIAMADISTVEEGINAYKMGVDIISTTLSGYTTYSRQTEEPDFELLKNLVHEVKCPVIAEGKIWERCQVKEAFDLGAYSVVIGSAVTRPWLIVERFVNYNG